MAETHKEITVLHTVCVSPQECRGMYKDFRTNDSISVLLVDIVNRRIAEEFVFRSRDGKVGDSIINHYNSSVGDSYEEEYDDLIWDDEE